MLDSINGKTEQEFFELKTKLSAINLAIKNAQVCLPFQRRQRKYA